MFWKSFGAGLLLAAAMIAAGETRANQLDAVAAMVPRPTIEFNTQELAGGTVLLATPKSAKARAMYPDLRNELRRQWHAANPKRQLIGCRYERMVVGEISCTIVKK